MVTKKVIGKVGVDAGILMLIDPCYIKHQPVFYDPEKWNEFVDIYYGTGNEGGKKGYKSMGGGVVFNTRNGDGEFPVVAHYDKSGELLKVEVSFK